MSSRIVSITVIVIALTFSAYAADAGKWVASKSGTGGSLAYSGTATVMGMPTPITLKFFCDTAYSESEKGAIGFDLTFGHVAALAPFGFDNFEGPDAPAFSKELLDLAIARKGKPPLTFKLAPNGPYPEEGSFSFGAAEVTHEAVSTPKSIIRAPERRRRESADHHYGFPEREVEAGCDNPGRRATGGVQSLTYRSEMR